MGLFPMRMFRLMEDPSLYYNSNITLKSPFSLTSSNLIPHSQDPEAAKQIKLRVGGVVMSIHLALYSASLALGIIPGSIFISISLLAAKITEPVQIFPPCFNGRAALLHNS
jgi:hypothetical protein